MNEKKNGMVRKASDLTSLDELNLSNSTRRYLEKNFSSLGEIILKGRWIAYDGNIKTNWGNELVEVLDAAGFIRHDFDEVTIKIAHDILDDYGYRNIDLVLAMGDFVLRSYFPTLGNEEYEFFRPFTNTQKEFILDGIGKSKVYKNPLCVKILKSEWGLDDGHPKNVKETEAVLGLDYSQIRKPRLVAMSNLHRVRFYFEEEDGECYKTLNLIDVLRSRSIIEGCIREAEKLREEKRQLEDDFLYDLRETLRAFSNTPFDGSEEARNYLNSSEE